MAIHNYLDKTGLSQLWEKAKAAFLKNPSGGTEGQVLTKTDTGVKWADPLSNSDVPSSYLYASILGTDYDIVLEGQSYKNFTISNKQINFDDPGMYLLTMKFYQHDVNYIDVILKTNKNYKFTDISNIVYSFIVASTSDTPAKISYSFVGRYSQQVAFSIRKIQDDIADYIILYGKSATTLNVVSNIGITQSKNSGTYTLTFSKNGTYKLSAYSVTSKDTSLMCSFPQNSNFAIPVSEGDEIYFEINDISSDKLSLYGTADNPFTDFIITVEEV